LIWREVAPDGDDPTGFDEYYTYDGLHRLERSQRGTLSGTPYDSISSPVKTQDFGEKGTCYFLGSAVHLEP